MIIVRVSELDNQTEQLLLSKFILKTDPNYPKDALHIFAENNPVRRYNNHMLSLNSNSLYSINAINIIPKNVSQSIIDKALNKNQSETGGLATTLDLREEARVMLTSNIDIDDRLINGQIGTVRKIVLSGQVNKIYVAFDAKTAGLKLMDRDQYCKVHRFVPVERIEVKLR